MAMTTLAYYIFFDQKQKNVKKRDGIPVGKSEPGEMEMQELKGYNGKPSKGGNLNRIAATKQESGRLGKFDESSPAQRYFFQG